MSDILERLESFPFTSNVSGYTDIGRPVYDRAVGSRILRGAFSKFFGTGIFPNPAENLKISRAESGLAIIVGMGYAIIDGGIGGVENEEGLYVKLADSAPTATTTYSVFCRLDDDFDKRSLYIRVSDSAGTVPSEPVVAGTVHELRLGYVTVPSGALSIDAATIVDERGTSVCQYAAPFESIDMSAVIEEARRQAGIELESLGSYIEANVGLVQSALDGTTAGYLQGQINEAVKKTDLGSTIVKESGGKYEAVPKVDGKSVVYSEGALSAVIDIGSIKKRMNYLGNSDVIPIENYMTRSESITKGEIMYAPAKNYTSENYKAHGFFLTDENNACVRFSMMAGYGNGIFYYGGRSLEGFHVTKGARDICAKTDIPIPSDFYPTVNMPCALQMWGIFDNGGDYSQCHGYLVFVGLNIRGASGNVSNRMNAILSFSVDSDSVLSYSWNVYSTVNASNPLDSASLMTMYESNASTTSIGMCFPSSDHTAFRSLSVDNRGVRVISLSSDGDITYERAEWDVAKPGNHCYGLQSATSYASVDEDAFYTYNGIGSDLKATESTSEPTTLNCYRIRCAPGNVGVDKVVIDGVRLSRYIPLSNCPTKMMRIPSIGGSKVEMIDIDFDAGTYSVTPLFDNSKLVDYFGYGQNRVIWNSIMPTFNNTDNQLTMDSALWSALRSDGSAYIARRIVDPKHDILFDGAKLTDECRSVADVNKVYNTEVNATNDKADLASTMMRIGIVVMLKKNVLGLVEHCIGGYYPGIAVRDFKVNATSGTTVMYTIPRQTFYSMD